MPAHLSTVVSLAQIVGVLAAIIGLAVQIKRSRFSLSVELISSSTTSLTLSTLKQNDVKQLRPLQENKFNEVDDVLDFFETLGMLVRQNATKKEMVWHTFFHWIHGYWLTCSGYIAEKRLENSSTWQDFRSLHQVIS
jgi:hypothetical protein